MAGHVSRAFEDELTQLGIVIDRMGGLARDMLDAALLALDRRDALLAGRIAGQGGDVARLEGNLEALALRMIALRQPVSTDLRRILGAMRVGHELRRCGDLAAAIARRAVILAGAEGPDAVRRDARRLGADASGMLGRALRAWRRGDLDAARALWEEDAALDADCARIFSGLLTYLAGNARAIGFGLEMGFCIKHVERIGDHATNIAERVAFVMTGAAPPSERPKGPLLGA